MYVAVVPNRGSPPAILLRESYREAGKTKNRTLANLSRWPAERIEQLRAVLRGDKLLPAAEAVEIVRALPHGHVLAGLGTARRIASMLCCRAGAATPPRSGAGPDRCPPTRAGGQAGDRADAGSCHRQPFAGRGAGARQASPPRRSMPRSTGWAASSRSSKPGWPAATSRMARCCSMAEPER